MVKALNSFGGWIGRSKFSRMAFIILAMAWGAWAVWSSLPLPWHAKLLALGIAILVIIEWPTIRIGWQRWRARRAALKCWKR